MQRPLLRYHSMSLCRRGARGGARSASMVSSTAWAAAVRMASTPSSPSSSSASDGKRARAVETTNTTNGAVTVTFGQQDTKDAYNAFARLVGCCDADGLLRGSEQAYGSTAILVDSLLKPVADTTDQLIDESKEKLQKNILDPSARMSMSRWASPRTLVQAKNVLAEEYAVEVSDQRTSNPPSSSSTPAVGVSPSSTSSKAKTDGAAAPDDRDESVEALEAVLSDALNATQPGGALEAGILDAIQRILPMSAAMANKLFTMWCEHRKGTKDVLQLAARSDLVVESQLVAFIRFDDAVLHYNPIEDCVRSMDVTLSDAVFAHWKTHAIQDHASAADVPTTTSSEAPGAPGMTRLTASPAASPSAAPDGDVAEYTARIHVDATVMNDVPMGAKALVLVALDVVCPPRRFARYYDYFYSRIVGCENEYQLMAVARLFALHTPRFLVRMLEVLTKPLTGQFEIGYTAYVGRKLQLPEDMSHSIPTTRKLVCFYLDSANRWVLSDIINTGGVISKLPPMPEGATL